MVNIYYPKYLADDMQNYIMKTLNESDMNVDVYDILEHKHADTSNIFSLMKDVYWHILSIVQYFSLDINNNRILSAWKRMVFYIADLNEGLIIPKFRF